MAATIMRSAVGSIQTHRGHVSSSSQNGTGNFSVKMVSKGFGIDMRLLGRGSCSRSSKLGVIHASTSTSSFADPVQAPSKSSASNSQKKSSNLLILF